MGQGQPNSRGTGSWAHAIVKLSSVKMIIPADWGFQFQLLFSIEQSVLAVQSLIDNFYSNFHVVHCLRLS